MNLNIYMHIYCTGVSRCIWKYV